VLGKGDRVVVGERDHPLGADRAGRDDVDADAVLGRFSSKCP
jgi:hypothetical protein